MGHARARVSRVDVSLPSSPVSGVHSAVERGGGHVHTPPTVSKENTNGLSAQAGAIIVRRLLRLSRGVSLTHALGQGIHNLFIVIPQFLVTGFSSIVFALLDPDKSVLHGYHPGNAAPQQGARAGGSTMQEARERTRDDGGTDSIAVTFWWGSLYGSGRTFRWLIYSRMCARWVCCNYVGFRRTNYNVFATKRFDLAIFEPIDLTMRVKYLMFASLLRPRVKQILTSNRKKET